MKRTKNFQTIVLKILFLLSVITTTLLENVQNRYLVVLFAFETSSFQQHIVYVQEHEFRMPPKYSSCIKLTNLCGNGVKILPYICTPS